MKGINRTWGRKAEFNLVELKAPVVNSIVRKEKFFKLKSECCGFCELNAYLKKGEINDL